MIEKIIKLQEIDSTHKFALQMIDNKKAFECAIIAKHQTSGIGRCGRQWISGSGNLYTSIIRKMRVGDELGRISLATACAVHSVISTYVQDKENLQLHWPNDIYYKNLKISGILLAVIDDWIVISIGVNIQSVEVDTAISLADINSGIELAPVNLLQDILGELDCWLSLQYISNFVCIREYWLEHMCGLNSAITVKNGKDAVTGIMNGIDDFGRLILKNDDRNLYISSGDIFINENKITVNYE